MKHWDKCIGLGGTHLGNALCSADEKGLEGGSNIRTRLESRWPCGAHVFRVLVYNILLGDNDRTERPFSHVLIMLVLSFDL